MKKRKEEILMKKMKKMLSLLLAVVMVLSLTLVASAAGEPVQGESPNVKGTITITNAIKSATYEAYKVFDVTYSESGANVAYYYRGGNTAFITALTKTAEEDPNNPFDAKRTANPGVEEYIVTLRSGKTAADVSAFLTANILNLGDVVATSNLGEGVDEDTLENGVKVKKDGSTVTFSELPLGYYYVTSTSGSVVTLDTTNPEVTIIDKNRTPGWDPKEDPENPSDPDTPPTKPGDGTENGKFVADSKTLDAAVNAAIADAEAKAEAAGSSSEEKADAVAKAVAKAEYEIYDKTSTEAIKDEVDFKINAYAPKYAGNKLVADYIFTDTLSKGFTLLDDQKNPIKITLNGKELVRDTDNETQDYKVEVTGNTVVKFIVHAAAIENYPENGHLSITYSAKVDEDAEYDNTNTVEMDWKVYPNDPVTGKPDTGTPGNPTTPYDPKDPKDPGHPYYNPEDPEHPNYPGGQDDPNGPDDTTPTDPNHPNYPGNPDKPSNSETNTYTYGFNLQKYKDSDTAGNEIDGARFKLYDSLEGGNEIKLVYKDGQYRVATEAQIEAEKTTEGTLAPYIEAGRAQIFGLKDNTTYYLEEIKAPNGYNILTARESFTVKSDTNSENEDKQDNVDKNTGIVKNLSKVVNKKGILLPSTGGIGTTIFYVIGAILVLGAGVLLVTKRRMSRNI